jgi:hypothetical protein
MRRRLLVSAIMFFVPFAGCQRAARPGGNASGRALTRVDLSRWKLQVDGAPIQGGIPAYSPLDETGASSAVIELAAEARAPTNVAYIALVRHKQDAPTAFVGGTVTGPIGSLISVGVELSNSDQKPATFFVGDVALVSSNGQRLRFVAVSKGDSPLVAKFSDKAEKASEAVPVTVDAGETVRLNYCFLITPNSFPLGLQFGTAKTGIILKDSQALSARKTEDEGFSVSLGGAIQVSADFPAQVLESTVGQSGAVLHFESISLKKGDQLAASGARSMDTLPDVPGPEVPLVESSQGHMYIAGKLSVLQPITSIRTTATIQGREVTFTNSFQAKAGDVLGATFSNLEDDGECVLSQYIVIQSKD